ncbi:MAG: hypothetical protein GY750_02525 [Lentisphaerae bacterium]|nr:hypothetical protein [Lentisphaerota bacterium]MCP4100297.1 hypothetical protein [Lentisphaerota bacterium]
MLFRKITLLLAVSAAAFLSVTVEAAKYQADVNFFSGEVECPCEVYTFPVDFKKAIDLSSLNMRLTDRHGEIIPIYVIPFAPYKARICFVLPKPVPDDTEITFFLTWNTGKWINKPVGDAKVKARYNPGFNPIVNPGFEQVEKCDTQYSTWNGKIRPTGWKLYDHEHRFFTLKNKKSRSRVSEEQAFDGKRSLKISSGLPRTYYGTDGEETVILSGKAITEDYFRVKPGTLYELSFFMKITKKVNNDRKFQGVCALMLLYDRNKKPLDSSSKVLASYSTAFVAEEEYLNKWLKVAKCERIPSNACYAKIYMSSEVSGDAFIDTIELREMNQCPQPEIYMENILKMK